MAPPCHTSSSSSTVSLEDRIDDVEVVKAAKSLTATPESQAYDQQAYAALVNVQESCAADLSSLCPTQSQQAQALGRAMDGMIFQLMSAQLGSFVSYGPGLGSVDEDDESLEYEEPDADGLTFGGDSNTIVFEFGRRLTAKPAASGKREGLRLLTSLKRRFVSPVLELAGLAGRGAHQATPSAARRLQMTPPHERHGGRVGGSHDHDHHLMDGPRSPRGKDVYYSGSLGLGQQDACVYQNFAGLSPQCQQAVASVYQVRQDYWQDVQQASHPPHHGGFPWPLLLLLPVVVVLAIKRRQRRLRVNKTLDAIHANPQLKQMLEAAMGGDKVPESAVPCKRLCRGGPMGCARVLLRLVLVVLASFVIAASSLVVSVNIVSGLSHTAADGSVSHPSQPVALLVLLLVTSIEVLLFVTMLKGCKLMCSPSPFPTAEAAPQLGPSAPVAAYSPSPSLSEPLVPEGRPEGDTPRYRSFFTRLARYVPSAGALGLSAGYSSVASQEDYREFVEMPEVRSAHSASSTAFYPGNQPLVQVQSVPLPIQQHSVYVATPVSHVSML